jgi:hypothetical protein
MPAIDAIYRHIHFRPLSSLATFENRALDALGSSLDEKMQSLIGALASPVGTIVK